MFFLKYVVLSSASGFALQDDVSFLILAVKIFLP